MLYSLSNLDGKRLEAIQSLEKELGSPLLAFSSVPVGDAEVPEDKLRRLQELEQELGVVLVAVKPS